jgi:hypothetical protein
MEKGSKVSYSDFVRQVAKESGYAQKNISEVLEVASKCIADNLNKEISTTVMKGIIIYPGKYPATDRKDDNGNIIHCDEVIYPRARFGQSFKKQLLFS